MTEYRRYNPLRDARGRYCDPRGKNRQWRLRLARTPDRLKQASKPRIVEELLRLREQRDLLAQTVGAMPSFRQQAARIHAMRKKQDDEVERRVACLRELVIEAAIRRQLITPDRYKALAGAMSERLGKAFHPATLYREPYCLILEDPDHEDAAPGKARRILMRESRLSLLKSVDALLLEIDRHRGMIQSALEVTTIEPPSPEAAHPLYT